jgi:hypothetical protein
MRTRSVRPSTVALVLLLLLVAPTSQAQAVRSGSNTGRSANAADKNSVDATGLRSESSESVDVGGVTLRLGMTEDDAIHRLCEGYKLKEITSPAAAGSQWFVQGKHQVVATVSFLAGRLASISKDWMAAGEPDTEAGFVEALYSAIKNYEEKGHTPCDVKTKTWQDASGEPERDSGYMPCGKPTEVFLDGRHLCAKHDPTDYKAKWMAAQRALEATNPLVGPLE